VILRALAAVALCLAPAALAAPPVVDLQPTTVVLGTDAQVSLRVVTTGGRGARLKAAAQVGELSASEVLSPDEVRFTWKVPASRFPQVAMLAFWIAGVVEAPEIAVVRIPLIGRTELEAKTEPGAEVRAEVAGKSFGPRTADSRGRVKVPIEVPPGVDSARVLGQAGRKETSMDVPLTVPAYNPLLAVISPDPMGADHGGWLWVVHADKLDPGQLELAVQGASRACPGAIPIARCTSSSPSPAPSS
jgi:hypothetical protein